MDIPYRNTPETRKQAQGLRAKAIQDGMQFYFTGNPCVRGHLAKRRTSNSKCIECNTVYNRQWHRNNPEKAKAISRRTYAKHIEAHRIRNNVRHHSRSLEERRASAKKGYWNNIEKRREKSRKDARKYWDKYKEKRALYRKRNAGRLNALLAKYRARKLRATPVWANQDKMRSIYIEAKRLQKQNGVKYDVDHIIPLQGIAVCGLHVENNLQILLSSQNRSKHNKLIL
jgi:hypothetical protein